MAIQPLQLPPPVAAPQADLSPLGQLGDVFRQSQMRRRREQLLSTLPPNADSQSLMAIGLQLAKAGDLEGSQRFLTAGQSMASLALQTRKVEVDEGQLGLAREQAKEKPQLQKIKDAAGNERLVQVSPSGASRNIDTGAPTTPTNPYAADGKLTSDQATSALYARRMMTSEPVLREMENVGTSFTQRGLAVVGNYIGFNLNSPEYQRFDQAKRDFINATLRRESGAVISPAEFDNAEKQYFPRPGDDQKTIEQKRRNRIEAIKGIAGAAGPGWQPPATIQGDAVVPRPASPAPAGGAPPSSPPAGAPVRVSSAQERDALAPGTPYIAPDGSVRIKQ